MDTTTSDLMMDEDGYAGVYGTLSDGREFGFSVPLHGSGEPWFRRLCDAIAGVPGFVDSLMVLDTAGPDFVIPAAPSRDGGAVGRLARMGNKAKFRDFADVRSGRDRFSSVKLTELRDAVPTASVEFALSRMSKVAETDRDAELAKTLRWMLRGLPADMAIRKTEVDREITLNATQKRRR